MTTPDLCWGALLPDIAPAGWPLALEPTALADLAGVAERIPHRGTDAFIAEARLDGIDAQVDVSVRLSATAGPHWVHAAGVHPAFDPDHHAWHVVRALLSPTRPAVLASLARPECWIEFDRRPQATQTAPSVFVSLRRDCAVTACDLFALLDALQAPVSLPVRRSLLRLCALLPVRAQVAQLGLMLARGPDAPLRICLTGLTDDDLSQLWRRMGRRGDDPSALRRRLRSGHGPVPDYVDCDLTDGLGDRVGLEFRCDRRAQATGQVREAAWLRARRQEGLMSARWLDALLTWPGARRVRLPHQLWPSLTERTLNHCKLVVQHGEAAGLKGYCMLRHQDAPSRRLASGVHSLSTGESYDRTTAVA